MMKLSVDAGAEIMNVKRMFGQDSGLGPRTLLLQ